MLRDPVGTVAGRFAQYGDLYYVQNRDAPLFVTRDPEVIREILVARAGHFGKGHSSFRLLKTVLGDSLLTSDGDMWRRQRRLVQPAFTRPRLAEYGAIMAAEASQQAEALATPRPRAVDLSAIITGLTLRIVSRTLFGQSIDDSPRIGRAMRWLNNAFATPDLLPRNVPTPTRMRMQRANSDLNAAVHEIIEHRRKQLAQGYAPPPDLLQRLLLARDEEGDGAGLTDQEIRDQLLTLYLAGHDTTTHAVTWTMYLLSQHPAALQRLRAELDRVLAGRPPTFEDLTQLNYTGWAFKEAMRLYPPVVAIPRCAEHDTTLGGYPVPRGAEVVIWVYHVHRHPSYYPAPERFEPERFSEKEEAQRPRYAYLPFGAGQRACIGQQFAIYEGQLILAALVQRLQFKYAARSAPRLRFGVTLAPKGGMPMVISRR